MGWAKSDRTGIGLRIARRERVEGGRERARDWPLI